MWKAPSSYNQFLVTPASPVATKRIKRPHIFKQVCPITVICSTLPFTITICETFTDNLMCVFLAKVPYDDKDQKALIRPEFTKTKQ